jgi:regulator of replication initiation timing
MSKKYLKTQFKNSGEEMNKQAYYSEASYAEDFIVDQTDYAEDEELSVLEQAIKEFGSDEEGVVMDVFPTGAFSENDFSEKEFGDMTLQEALDSMMEGDESLGELAEELEKLDEEVEELVEEHGDMKLSDLIPGSDLSAADLDEDKEEKETDYANDGDLTKFMDYITSEYPKNIPSHDGRSTTGCEKAIVFLDKLNSQISRAIKDDVDSVLDLEKLEEIRGSIMRDVITLKDHLNNLKRKIKEQHSKKASDAPPAWKNSAGESVDIVKEATTPHNRGIVITITPFQRAITGMMINAHVSAGKPMAETFEALKKKYDITDREELEIIQICMDSGFPFFKDRGTVGDKDEDRLSVDFMKNYLA